MNYRGVSIADIICLNVDGINQNHWYFSSFFFWPETFISQKHSRYFLVYKKRYFFFQMNMMTVHCWLQTIWTCTAQGSIKREFLWDLQSMLDKISVFFHQQGQSVSSFHLQLSLIGIEIKFLSVHYFLMTQLVKGEGPVEINIWNSQINACIRVQSWIFISNMSFVLHSVVTSATVLW